MGFHTYDVDRADALEDPARYEYLSVEEVLALVDTRPTDVVLDVGSGTGFYTDHFAPYAGTVYALDLQAEMHAIYREKGLPENVVPVTAAADNLPFGTGTVDHAVTTMTYHEFASETALSELARVLRPCGQFGLADWTGAGEGAEGPPLAERYDLADAIEALDAVGFAIDHAEERRETFIVRARLPD